MTKLNLENKTVIELRKIAKYYGVKLGAGLSKESILAKLRDALQTLPEEEDLPFLTGDDKPARRGRRPNSEKLAEAKPGFVVRKAEQLSFGQEQRPAAPEQPAAAERPMAGQKRRLDGEDVEVAWVNPSPGSRGGRREARKITAPADSVHLQTVRPANYTPRFGPGSAEPAAQRGSTLRLPPKDVSRPAAPQSAEHPAAEKPMPDLFKAGELLPVSGVFEPHPDGYGFLRAANQLIPTSKDVFVAMSQVRRFSLRPGDLIAGQARPMRDTDKYIALMTVEQINGRPADAQQPAKFGELTACYPFHQLPVDFLPEIPVGYGQRALIVCDSGTDQLTLLRSLTVKAQQCDAAVFSWLVNVRPEDASIYREGLSSTVYAASYDQYPDYTLRQGDLLLECAERRVESGENVILLLNSLTELAGLYPLAAQQQGRAQPGVPCPSSLQKARRLFGAARATKEAGSLTVLAMVDQSLLNVFEPMANCLIRVSREGELTAEGSYTLHGDAMYRD